MADQHLPISAVIEKPDGGLEHVLVDNTLAVHLYDDETRLRVDADQLSALRVTDAAAFIAARRRRQARLLGARIAQHAAAPAIQLVSSEEGDAANLLLCLRDIVRPFPPNGVLVMVPAANQLMVLPLVDLASLGWMDVLVNAGHTAFRTADRPFSTDLFWYDGSDFATFSQEMTEVGIRLDPPPGFRTALRSLASRALRTVDAVA